METPLRSRCVVSLKRRQKIRLSLPGSQVSWNFPNSFDSRFPVLRYLPQRHLSLRSITMN